jgi:ABC-type hemin transport system ATPase subunit
MQEGRVLSAGPPETALTAQTLSQLYGVPMAVCPVTVEGRTFPVSLTLSGE